MSHLHWFLAILSALAWIGIVIVDRWQQLSDFVISRFEKPRTDPTTPEEEEALRTPIFERAETPKPDHETRPHS